MESLFGSPLPPLDIERFKALPRPELVEALLAEAHEAIQREPESDRGITEGNVFAICWLPSEEDVLRRDQEIAELDEGLGRIASEIFENSTGEILDAEEALRRTKEQAMNRSIKRFSEYRCELEKAIDTQNTAPYALKVIMDAMCGAQMSSGIHLGTDYIREIALEKIAEDPEVRGMVLMHNACADDPASFEHGVLALREAVDSHLLTNEQASQALRFTLYYLKNFSPRQAENHRGLMLDLLALMRQDQRISHYPETVARLAVTFRDMPPEKTE